jgi:hypothetical protein
MFRRIKMNQKIILPNGIPNLGAKPMVNPIADLLNNIKEIKEVMEKIKEMNENMIQFKEIMERIEANQNSSRPHEWPKHEEKKDPNSWDVLELD